MNHGETINAWLAPVADRFGAVVSYPVPVLRQEPVVNIVESPGFCMAMPNLIAVYLLLPQLRQELARCWQRVVLEGSVRNRPDVA